MKCSLGIFAYNEGKNIGFLLESLLGQNLKNAQIDEILVMADGSSDKTESIALSFAEKNKAIKVFASKERRGKSRAVNDFIKKARNTILVMESGDTIPDENVIEEILLPFKDLKVGMVGARPKPLNDKKTFMGFVSHLIWNLHHLISLKNPKMGEMVAFRKVFDSIPLTAVDEAYIEYLVKKKGYNVVYAPKAIVYNKGAENLKDFLRQRRRIFCGHLRLKKKGYRVSTDSISKTLSLIIKNQPFGESARRRPAKFNLRNLFFVPAAILIEAFARVLGFWDYLIGKDHIIWEISETTKKLK